MTTSNTPAIRLEQNNSGGFTAQTWDVAGNEANFFVRDLTGGSRLPFRIRPGAPTSSIDIAANGNVGLGIASAAAKLHVFGAANADTFAALGPSYVAHRRRRLQYRLWRRFARCGRIVPQCPLGRLATAS